MFKVLMIVVTWFLFLTPQANAMKFQVAHDGEVRAQFLGQSAAYDNILQFKFDGIKSDTEINNHGINIGDSFSLGDHNVGTTLEFLDFIVNTGDVWSSNSFYNSDGIAHMKYVEITDVGIDAVFITFEDLRGGGDLDFNDTAFLVTNIVPSVPEPETYGMLLVGLMLIWSVSRRSSSI